MDRRCPGRPYGTEACLVGDFLPGMCPFPGTYSPEEPPRRWSNGLLHRHNLYPRCGAPPPDLNPTMNRILSLLPLIGLSASLLVSQPQDPGQCIRLAAALDLPH